MHRRFTLALCALALLVLASAPAARSATRPGELLGYITGLPANSLFGQVEAIAPNGRIATARQLRSTGGFKIGVPPGDYLLLGSATALSGENLLTVSAPVRSRSHRATKVRSRLKAVKAALPRLEPLAHGAVVTVASIAVVDNGGGTELGGAELREHVASILFERCSTQGTIFVDTSPQFVAAAKQERALSLAHRLSTPFDYRPLKPQFVIGGQVEVKRGSAPPPHNISLSVLLTATSVSSGQVVARGGAGLPEGSTEITPATLQSTLDVAIEGLARAGCGSGAL